jgi:hypothetical protein
MTTRRALQGCAIVAFVVVASAMPCVWAQAARADPSLQGVGDALTSDFKYLANNVEADGEDIVTAPLHLSSEA